MRLTLPLAAAVAFLAVSAFAGPLADDTNTLGGIWHGSTPFATYFDYPVKAIEAPLSGQIDWAVYAPGQFPAGFTGYVPDPLQYVYAYQIILTISDLPLAGFDVPLVEIAKSIGVFAGDGGFGQVSGAAPNQMNLSISSAFPSAQWDFDNSLSILVSDGLVFTSPSRPHLGDGAVFGYSSIDFTDLAVDVFPVPSPFYLPEPSSFILAALGLVGFVVWRRRKL